MQSTGRGQQGGRRYGGFGRGGRGGRGAAANFQPAHVNSGRSSSPAQSTTSRNAGKPKSTPVVVPTRSLWLIERYKPRPGSVDQAYLGQRGSRANWPLCLRCGKSKGMLHPAFADCADRCGLCESHGHQGVPCPLIYASVKRWGTHHGSVPDNCQVRPSEPRRLQLAEQDEWFRHNPPPVEEMQYQAVQGTKCKAEAGWQEFEQRKRKLAEDFMDEKLVKAAKMTDDAEDEVLEAKKKVLTAEQEARAAKRQEMEANERAEKLAKVVEVKEMQNKQLALGLQQLEKQNREAVEEFATTKDALARQQQARVDELTKKMQEQFRDELRLEVEGAVARVNAEWHAKLAALGLTIDSAQLEDMKTLQNLTKLKSELNEEQARRDEEEADDDEELQEELASIEAQLQNSQPQAAPAKDVEMEDADNEKRKKKKRKAKTKSDEGCPPEDQIDWGDSDL